MLLDIGILAVDAKSCDQGYNDTANQKLVVTSCVTRWVAPLVQGIREIPSVVGKPAAGTAIVTWVSRARRRALRFWPDGTTIGGNVSNITAICRITLAFDRTWMLEFNIQHSWPYSMPPAIKPKLEQRVRHSVAELLLARMVCHFQILWFWPSLSFISPCWAGM